MPNDTETTPLAHVNVPDFDFGTVASAAVTNAVEAICSVLVPGAAVGTVGTPENIGDARLAFAAMAAAIAACTNAVVAICVVLVVAGDAVGAVGVPVSTGELMGASPAVLTPVFCIFVPSQ